MAQEQRREITVTIKALCGDYAMDVSASCRVDQVPRLAEKLSAAGITPASSPYRWPAPVAGELADVSALQPPTCKFHGVQMKPSKHGSGWYCSAVVGTDASGKRVYC